MIDVAGFGVSIRNKKAIVPLLKGVSFSLNQGETLGITGESGSGKSLITYALLGLLNRSAVLEGRIALCGCRDLLKAGEQELRQLRRRKIGYVPQNPQGALTPTSKIGTQLMEVVAAKTGLRRKAAADYAAGLLLKVGFNEPDRILRCYPHQLSGGMCQRVAVAMAIAGGPEVIVADEPTSSLDLVSKNGIMTLIKQAQLEYRFTLVLVTHELSLALKYCDMLAVFYSGRLVELGTAQKVFDNPRHPYVKDLTGCFFHEMDDHEAAFFQNETPALSDLLPGCRYFPCCRERMAVCGEKEPPLYGTGNSRVACWLYGEGAGE